MRSTFLFATTVLVFTFLLLFYIFCSENVSLLNKSTEKENFRITLLLKSMSTTIKSIVGILERDGFSSIQRDFSISSDSAYADFGEVIAGIWHLTVSAYDSILQEIYHGETDVTIIAGQTNTVYLTLNPVTGGLIVIVNWGTQPSGDYIYTYSFRPSPYNVYRYNLQNSLLEQLTDSVMSEFPLYISNLEKIGYQHPYVHEFWLMNLNGTNQSYYFSMNFDMEKPVYSAGSQKLCFYVIENDYRRLGIMNYDGTDFEYLTASVNYNNATPDINDSGELILYQSDQSGVYNIYLLNLSNMVSEQLTFNSIRSVYPQWSRVHRGFYYLRESSNLVEIIFYNLANSTLETVASFEYPYVLDYVFSPNEDRLALICSETWSLETVRNLYLYDINNHTLSQMTYTDLSFDRPRWYHF
jgi:Tol biopolymer transport system component